MHHFDTPPVPATWRRPQRRGLARSALGLVLAGLGLAGCTALHPQPRALSSVEDCRTRSDCVVPVTVGAVEPGRDHDCGIAVVDAVFTKIGRTQSIVFNLQPPANSKFEYRFPELGSPNQKVGIFVYPDGTGPGPAFGRQRNSASSFTLIPAMRQLSVNSYGIYLQYRAAGVAGAGWTDCKEYDPIIISMD